MDIKTALEELQKALASEFSKAYDEYWFLLSQAVAEKNQGIVRSAVSYDEKMSIFKDIIGLVSRSIESYGHTEEAWAFIEYLSRMDTNSNQDGSLVSRTTHELIHALVLNAGKKAGLSA